MLVTIRYIEGCPSLELARTLVREALIVTGHPGAEVRVELVATQAVAAALQFRGSPSFMLDGRDLFDAGGPDRYGLACRIYSTPGGPRGCPTLGQLVEAIDTVEHGRRSRPAESGDPGPL